eukprot:6056475-Amphidinium_carterae.1
MSSRSSVNTVQIYIQSEVIEAYVVTVNIDRIQRDVFKADVDKASKAGNQSEVTEAEVLMVNVDGIQHTKSLKLMSAVT